MVAPTRPPANGFVRVARQVYNPLGFSKGYNAVLFTIFIGALLGFTLARLEYLSFYGVFCNPNGKAGVDTAAPGECFWYRSYRRNNVGIIMHLSTILPASLLACLQFVPAIRHRFLRYHRAAGYVILLLLIPSQAGVIMIADHAFGGDNATRSLIGTLVLFTTTSVGLAYYNIKRLQIDQHRAWMLRAWAAFASIITLRLIMLIATKVQASWGGEALTYVAYPCEELLFLFKGNSSILYEAYAACRPENLGFTTNGQVVVQANAAIKSGPNQAAALDTFFGASGWLALALHLLAVELYLKLTPAETERLRRVSYERQLKRGLRHPGSAGLTADRLGDSEAWVPPAKVEEEVSHSMSTDGVSP